MVLRAFFGKIFGKIVPEQQFPGLFSFAKKKGISIRTARDANGPEALFHLPISDVALQQLLILAEDLNNIQKTSNFDLWSYIWGSFLGLQSLCSSHWPSCHPCYIQMALEIFMPK